MAGNTALSYQMMIEEKFMSAMINAEQRGNYSFACQYAKTHLHFIDDDNKIKLPKMPVLLKTEAEKQQAYATHYFNLLDLIATTTGKKIAEVRKKYGGKGKKGLFE